jgi:ATP-binding cassette subfamily B (MDR/TAP) protein 1
MAVISVVASSILSIIVSWKIGLVGVFAGLPPVILSSWICIGLQTKMDERLGQSLASSASVASETVMAIRIVSSLALEQTVLKKYVDELDRAITQISGPMFHMTVYFSFAQSVEYFVLALGFW